MAEGEKSLIWIIVMVMACIALFGWGFLAGSYDGAHSGNMSEITAEELKDLKLPSPRRVRGFSIGTFIGNAIEQLPNCVTVVTWHLSNRIWLPVTIVALEVAVLIGGVVLKRVESALETPRSRRR